jgi:hypothetical protein
LNDGDHALVVGIDRYPNLTSLQGAVNDAEAFGSWLQGIGQVPAQNVHMITSRVMTEPDRPILDQIDDDFMSIVQAAEAGPARRLYVYFAGHGCSKEIRHLALVMANASKGMLNRSFNTSEYHTSLAGMGVFAEQVFLYDCCRNYDSRVEGHPPGFTLAAPGSGAGLVSQFILYGTAFTQYANEARQVYSTNRGLFTVALIEGLSGGAARRDNGTWAVRWTTLIPFVDARLQQLARQQGLIQRVSRNEAGVLTDIILAEGVTPRLQTVTVRTTPPGGELVVRDGIGTEIDRKRNAELVTFQLPPGLYSFRHEPSMTTEPGEVLPGEDLAVVVPHA